MSEVVDTGFCSIKAAADDIHGNHLIDLATFREKVISNKNSKGSYYNAEL